MFFKKKCRGEYSVNEDKDDDINLQLSLSPEISDFRSDINSGEDVSELSLMYVIHTIFICFLYIYIYDFYFFLSFF